MYFVYVLFSQKINKHYTGHTKNLTKRLEHHNLGLNKWSKRGIPWKIMYVEEYKTRSEAFRREKYLKTGAGREFISKQLR